MRPGEYELTRQTTAERIQVRKERNQGVVRAKVSENLQAGLGVASTILGGSLLVYTVGEWSVLPQPLPIGGVAVGAGLIWFGALSVLRFSMDEIRDAYQNWRWQELATSQRLKIEQLTADNTELRRENKRLQAMVKTQEFNKASEGAREVVKAVGKFDALRKNIDDILDRWSRGLKYGRDDVTMTRPEWEAAMQCLASAGLVGADERNPRKKVILADSLQQANKRVDAKISAWEKFDGTNFTPA